MHTNWCVLIEISMEIGMLNFVSGIIGHCTARKEESHFSMNSIIKFLRIHRNKNDPSNIISTHCVWDANAFQFDAKLYSHLKSFSAAPTFVTPKSLVLSAVRGNITKLWEIRSEAQRKQERSLFKNCTYYNCQKSNSLKLTVQNVRYQQSKSIFNVENQGNL